MNIRFIKIITIIESVYLLYMFYIYKTKFSFNSAIFDKEIQSWSSNFIHNSNKYENKICNFGKLMAVIAVIFAFYRLDLLQNFQNKLPVLYGTIIFDITCIFLSIIMNMNAFIYILPLIIGESIIINMIKD